MLIFLENIVIYNYNAMFSFLGTDMLIQPKAWVYTNMLLWDSIRLVIFCYCRQCYVAVFLRRERIFVFDE